MIREFHRHRAELILASFAKEILSNTDNLQVYVPTANPLATFDYLIVTDGTGVVYVDQLVGTGPVLSCPLFDRHTGKITASPFGKIDRDYNAYCQTKAELSRIQAILPLFKEEGWIRLRKGLLKFLPVRHYIFKDFNEYRYWASRFHDIVPYDEYVRKRGGDIRNFNGDQTEPDENEDV